MGRVETGRSQLRRGGHVQPRGEPRVWNADTAAMLPAGLSLGVQLGVVSPAPYSVQLAPANPLCPGVGRSLCSCLRAICSRIRHRLNREFAWRGSIVSCLLPSPPTTVLLRWMIGFLWALLYGFSRVTGAFHEWRRSSTKWWIFDREPQVAALCVNKHMG